MSNYILASNKSWHIKYFLENRQELEGTWSVATCPRDLYTQADNLKPRYIFFPHWSEIVPKPFVEKYECVCFHMADVPYGRGGSPLQNLIVRGHKETFVSALRMEQKVDAGPVYLKAHLDLGGSALDIFNRSASICFNMMLEITKKNIEPTPQMGNPTVFRRRTPDESVVSGISSLEKLYDFIRMLDAPDYPSAFINYESFQIEFSDAILVSETELNAKVRIKNYE